MCYICNSYPCNSRCPNAQEPIGFGKCESCHEAIYAGDEYAEIMGKKYHKECLDSFTTQDWLDILEECIVVAEVDY